MTTLPAIALLALTALLPAAAIAAPEIGAPAPAFTATDSNGKTVRLSDYRGKIVILERTRPDCPFVEKHYISGNIPHLQADASAEGAIWLTINSTPPDAPGYRTGRAANFALRAEGATPAAYLLDSDGTIAKAYDARSTPQIFIIAADGKLAYSGAIDDIASADPADLENAVQYVPRILRDLHEGHKIRRPTNRPYGCSVHY